ncbi:MAG: ATP-binding cassette domain-containing protein [Bacilli bacterium]|nr:ATP-binding cassette domain-containing protein [Bacilli bacterium]
MKNIVNIKNLNYKPFDNFNLTIKENSFIAISGPNNSGKTTLMRILNGEIDKNLPVKIFEKHLSDYKLGEYGEIVKGVFPLGEEFNSTLEEEISKINIKISSEEKNIILKKLHLQKLLKTYFNQMTEKEIILCQLLKALLQHPKILLIDELYLYFSHQEIMNIINFLKEYQQENDIVIIYTTINLEETIDLDYLYIISNTEVIIEGKPLEALQNDNLLNKLGLRVPFMVDLSVKLRDYDLLSDIELTPEGLVDKLWK